MLANRQRNVGGRIWDNLRNKQRKQTNGGRRRTRVNHPSEPSGFTSILHPPKTVAFTFYPNSAVSRLSVPDRQNYRVYCRGGGRNKDTSRRVVPTLFSDSLPVFKANRFKTDTGIIRGSIERINIEMDGPHPGPLTQSRNAFLSLDFPSTLPETPRPPCIRRIRAGKKRYLNNKLISSRHRDDRVYIVGGR